MSQSRTARISLQGMTCASCVARVERALLALSGVEQARVNLAEERVDLHYAPPATLAEVTQTLAKIGYPARQHTLDLAVEGMTCASCTGRVERVLQAQQGVLSATANLAARRAHITLLDGGADAASLARAVTKAGFAAEPLAEAKARPDPRATEIATLTRETWLAAILTAPVFLTEMTGHIIPASHHWLMANFDMQTLYAMQFILTTLVLLGPGRRFYLKGVPALLRAAPDMNSLVALGTFAAWAYSTAVFFAPHLFEAAQRVVYFESAAVIVVLILLGRRLEAGARGKAGAAIAGLVGLQPKTARVETAAGIIEQPIAALIPGQTLHIRPGERIPLDGTVTAGHSAVDEAMLTGEALPVTKTTGDTLTGGTVNGTGALVMQITHTGADTVLARIIALVEEAQGAKLPVQALVDRITLWFVPVVMALAALTVVLWLTFGPGIGAALVAGVSVLIIACPCAMGLATPVSIMVGTGRAAELGVLFRRGEALQSLANVATVAFDKTGTLTMGKPQMTDMAPRSDHMLRLAAAVEIFSEHPLAQAVVTAAQARGFDIPPATGFAALPGHGAYADVEGMRVAVGSARMMTGMEFGLHAQTADLYAQSGKTPIYVALDGKVMGVMALADTLKPHSKAAVTALRALGLRVAMITGDHTRVAQSIGAELGLTDIRAEILPGGKVAALADLTTPVVFVGDGINDAPALAAADVGIAMGTGTDVAIEAAEVVLMAGDPLGVATAITLSRAVMRNIRQNLTWAFGYNAALIPVAAGALVPFGGPQLSPMLAAGAMALSSVFVLTNALRLRRIKPQH